MIGFSFLEKFRDLHAPAYETLGDAVNIVDLEGTLIYANSACKKLYGYSEEELIGQPVSVLLSGGQREITAEMIQCAPNGKWEGEVGRKRKGAQEFPSHLTLTLIKDEDAEVVGRVAIVRDLTEQKKS